MRGAAPRGAARRRRAPDPAGRARHADRQDRRPACSTTTCCSAGVRIYEYCERPLHGKVALMDDEWATVGSSNLDPLSLSLNLEANVIIRDRAFNQHLQRAARASDAPQLQADRARQISASCSGWRLVRSFFVFHFLRAIRLGGLAAAPCAAPAAGADRPAAARAAPRGQGVTHERHARLPPQRDGRRARHRPPALVALDQAHRALRCFLRASWLACWCATRAPSTGTRCCKLAARHPAAGAAGRHRLRGRAATRSTAATTCSGGATPGTRCATRKVMGVNFISYAFNLNLGSLVGGVAFRYRLYSRLGLDNGADHPHRHGEHADQLDRLPGAGRLAVLLLAAGAAARAGRSSSDGLRMAGRGADGAGASPTSSPAARARRPQSGRCAGTSC